MMWGSPDTRVLPRLAGQDCGRDPTMDHILRCDVPPSMKATLTPKTESVPFHLGGPKTMVPIHFPTLLIVMI